MPPTAKTCGALSGPGSVPLRTRELPARPARTAALPVPPATTSFGPARAAPGEAAADRETAGDAHGQRPPAQRRRLGGGRRGGGPGRRRHCRRRRRRRGGRLDRPADDDAGRGDEGESCDQESDAERGAPRMAVLLGLRPVGCRSSRPGGAHRVDGSGGAGPRCGNGWSFHPPTLRSMLLGHHPQFLLPRQPRRTL